jgi:hypothetical protein
MDACARCAHAVFLAPRRLCSSPDGVHMVERYLWPVFSPSFHMRPYSQASLVIHHPSAYTFHSHAFMHVYACMADAGPDEPAAGTQVVRDPQGLRHAALLENRQAQNGNHKEKLQNESDSRASLSKDKRRKEEKKK